MHERARPYQWLPEWRVKFQSLPVYDWQMLKIRGTLLPWTLSYNRLWCRRCSHTIFRPARPCQKRPAFRFLYRANILNIVAAPTLTPSLSCSNSSEAKDTRETPSAVLKSFVLKGLTLPAFHIPFVVTQFCILPVRLIWARLRKK